MRHGNWVAASSRLGVAVVAVTIVLWPLCPRRSGAAEPSAADKLCTRLWSEYTETVKTGNWQKTADWFASDAVLLYPNMAELRGQDAIRAYFQNFEGVRFVSMGFRITQCGVVDDKVFSFASIDEAYQQVSGPQLRQTARCGVVWKRQADEAWRVLHFLVNEAQP